MNKNENQEWNRILANPDNVIVSDSLLDKLNPKDLFANTQHSKSVDITAMVQFENYTVEGTLVNYVLQADCIAFTMIGSLEKFVHVIHNMEIQRVCIHDSISNHKLEIIILPEDDLPEFELKCDDDHNASLAVTIKRTT